MGASDVFNMQPIPSACTYLIAETTETRLYVLGVEVERGVSRNEHALMPT